MGAETEAVAALIAPPTVHELTTEAFDTYLEADGIRIVFHDPDTHDRIEVLLTDGGAYGLAEEVVYALTQRATVRPDHLNRTEGAPMTRRFTIRGRDVRDAETGQVALMPDRQTAVAAARLMNAEPSCAPDYQWITEHTDGSRS